MFASARVKLIPCIPGNCPTPLQIDSADWNSPHAIGRPAYRSCLLPHARQPACLFVACVDSSSWVIFSVNRSLISLSRYRVVLLNVECEWLWRYKVFDSVWESLGTYRFPLFLFKRVYLTEEFYWANLASSGRLRIPTKRICFIRTMNFDIQVFFTVSISNVGDYLQSMSYVFLYF